MMDAVDSLKDQCLQAIVANLSRFSRAYKITVDPRLKRNFEYLQRSCANELLRLVTAVGPADLDSIPLLIHKNVSVLNLKIFNGIDGDLTRRIISDIGPGLNDLSVCDYRQQGRVELNYRFDDIIPCFSNVTILNLYRTCNDEVLKNISKYCPHVVELDITFGVFSKNNFITYLCNINNNVACKIRKLSVYHTAVDEDTVKLILQNFPLLEELDHYSLSCVLHRMHLKDFVQNNVCNLKQYKLNVLDILYYCEHYVLNPKILSLYASILPDLSYFSAEINTPEHFEELVKFTKLEGVYFVCNVPPPNFPSANVFISKRGAKLTRLLLERFCLSVDELINNCPHLEFLSLKSISFQPVASSSPNQLTSLRDLNLLGLMLHNVAESATAIIASAPKLEYIELKRCDYLNESLEAALISCSLRCPLKEMSFISSACTLRLVRSILVNSPTLRKLVVAKPRFPTSDSSFELKDLIEIVAKLRNKPAVSVTL